MDRNASLSMFQCPIPIAPRMFPMTSTVTKEAGGQKVDLREMQDYVEALSMQYNGFLTPDPWQVVWHLGAVTPCPSV
jgi:hypothetical protein